MRVPSRQRTGHGHYPETALFWTRSAEQDTFQSMLVLLLTDLQSAFVPWISYLLLQFDPLEPLRHSIAEISHKKQQCLNLQSCMLQSLVCARRG